MIKALFSKIKIFIFSVLGFNDIQYFDLIEEYEEYLNGNDVSERNVLVGAVRSKEQYQNNIDNLFYHIPEQYVSSPNKVEYIALYRSKNIFDNDNPGIIHYGKVLSFSKVKRSEISPHSFYSNSNDIYYLFEVSEWKTLPRCISAREKGLNVSYMTNSFVLFNSFYFYELYIDSNDMFKLNLAVYDIIKGVYDGFFVRETRVRIRGRKIIIKSPKGKYSFKVADYRRHPFATLIKMYDIIFTP